MKEIQSLSEDLSFVIGFNPQTLSGVQPTQTLLERGKELIFYGQAEDL